MSPAFKIEKFLDPIDVQKSGHNHAHHSEVMESLNSLHEKLSTFQAAEGTPNTVAISEAKETEARIKQEVEEQEQELLRLKNEMRSIYLAIDDTKREILTIKESGSEGQEMARAAEELSAIVKGTEEATNNILHAAEAIDNNASILIAALQDESQQAVACEIHENIVNIFESCNFQDLTGQRITKVVKTFCFIEQRIMKMMDIWGGSEAFLDVTPEELEARKGEKGLLNGPSLNDDEDVASQDDIDALFD